VPVVSTPAEIDVTTADQLRSVLFEATSGRQPVIVADMSRTQFCDSAGLSVVIRAHRRLLDEGRELRVVVGGDGALPRILQLTGMDRYLRCFDSLEQAVAQPGDGSAADSGASGPAPDQDEAAS
jgi:anti-sigma B factor antagonist